MGFLINETNQEMGSDFLYIFKNKGHPSALVLKVLRTESQGSAREPYGLRELFVYFCFYF